MTRFSTPRFPGPRFSNLGRAEAQALFQGWVRGFGATSADRAGRALMQLALADRIAAPMLAGSELAGQGHGMAGLFGKLSADLGESPLRR